MDDGLLIAGLIIIALGIGSVLGWVSIFSLKALRKENATIKKQLNHLSGIVDELKVKATAPEQQYDDDTPLKSAQETHTKLTRQEESLEIELDIGESSSLSSEMVDPWSESTIKNTSLQSIDNTTDWLASVKQHWMIWLGGISIGLAGIFLVKYSIDNGWLKPQARIGLAIAGGLVLHGAAFFLHRKKGQNDIFAALAGGASLILYAAVLAALHLYDLLSPNWAFVVLAMISLATMLLALVQGPVLAALGILGAYTVPIFVNTGSNNIVAALLYSFIVSCSALLLIRFVNRHWLWVGTLCGAVFWWALSLLSDNADSARLVYLLALAYTVMAIYCWDITLQRPVFSSVILIPSQSHWPPLFSVLLGREFAQNKDKAVIAALLIFLGLWFVSFVASPISYGLIVFASLFAIFSLWITYNQKILLPMAWFSLLVLIFALLSQVYFWDYSSSFDTAEYIILLYLLIAVSLIYSLASFLITPKSDSKAYWSSLGLLAPLACLAVAYVRIENFAGNYIWAMLSVLLGAMYFNILYRKKAYLKPTHKVAIIFSGHLAYSLAVVILLKEASLTLALAVQIISLTWLDRYFRLDMLPYFIKALVSIVILRLTLNPWLATYPVDLHWSLWVYGGSFVCCVLAAYIVKSRDDLLLWLKAAATHLLVLTILAETRYQLYDGNVFSTQYTFLEATLNTAILGALGIIYHLRMQAASRLAIVYRWASLILLIASLANYVLFVLLILNPLFDNYFANNTLIGSTPIFNILLLAYGLPCVYMATVFFLYKDVQLKRLLACFTVMGLFIFISLEVRHLWQGQLSINNVMKTGELYTYSMAWLALAIIGFVMGIRKRSDDLYRGSILLLLAVVAKIFLIDTAGLTSLWRVASFMVLGLVLLGLAYFYQKMNVSLKKE